MCYLRLTPPAGSRTKSAFGAEETAGAEIGKVRIPNPERTFGASSTADRSLEAPGDKFADMLNQFADRVELVAHDPAGSA